jgi:hypothetical protein
MAATVVMQGRPPQVVVVKVERAARAPQVLLEEQAVQGVLEALEALEALEVARKTLGLRPVTSLARVRSGRAPTTRWCSR